MRHRSSATPLAAVYAVLVVYASLYPFSGWRWPPGQTWVDMVRLDWPPWVVEFDLWSNGLGYLPLGALLLIAARRGGLRLMPALLGAVLLPALLSYVMEVLQHFVAGRHPSLKDLAMNVAGACAGALLAALAQALGLLDRWQRLRERWFGHGGAGAMALLALWPAALLFPTPVSFGLGQVGERLRQALAEALQDVAWAEAAYALVAAPPAPAAALRPLTEALIVACGLLLPCLVAYSVVAPGWRRLTLAAGAALLGAGGMTLSTLLNFGPQHALAWLTPATLPGLALGLLAAALLAPLPERLAAGVGLVVAIGLVAGVAQAPDDPYFAQSLAAWEQGRFVRFHGLAQWIGWLWPYTAMLWLLSRLGGRR